MDNLLYVLPVLACTVAMGLMMWFMMRGKHPAADQPSPSTAKEQELARLRKEVEALRGEQSPKADLHKGSPA